jgi:hypothetical protein
MDAEDLISKHVHEVSIDAENGQSVISPNNATFLINSIEPIVSFYMAGVIYFGNGHRKLFVVLCTIIFDATIPLLRDLDSVLDRSKIFTHTPTRDNLDKKNFGSNISRSKNGVILFVLLAFESGPNNSVDQGGIWNIRRGNIRIR